MSDRDAILAAVRANRPGQSRVGLSEAEGSSCPERSRSVEFHVSSAGSPEAILTKFVEVLAEIGGEAVEVGRHAVRDAVGARFPGVDPVFAEDLDTGVAPVSLASMEVFVCEGVLGVAENGAVWIPESRMHVRVAPFIAQHVVVVLDKTQLVPDMHAAYDRIDVAAEGFGVFVAGPSKTADIEQSLVLGAHGPRSLTVLLV